MSAKQETTRIQGSVRIAPCAACGNVRQVSGEVIRDKKTGKVTGVEGSRLCGVASCKRKRSRRLEKASKTIERFAKKGKK